MPLNTIHLRRTVDTLEQAIIHLQALPVERTDAASVSRDTKPGSSVTADGVLYDRYRNAAIKSFELSLETAGKLLRKALRPYAVQPREVDRLVFNDVLRQAGKHELLEIDEVSRWLKYRANRNTTAHDYGEDFANETMKLLPAYLQDARALADRLDEAANAAPLRQPSELASRLAGHAGKPASHPRAPSGRLGLRKPGYRRCP